MAGALAELGAAAPFLRQAEAQPRPFDPRSECFVPHPHLEYVRGRLTGRSNGEATVSTELGEVGEGHRGRGRGGGVGGGVNGRGGGGVDGMGRAPSAPSWERWGKGPRGWGGGGVNGGGGEWGWG